MSTPRLIPRQVLFGNPDRAAVQLSPDGQHLAWLAPRDSVLNVWVSPREHPEDARPVTADTGRGVRIYFWAFTNQHILYLQDNEGDENWHLYCAATESTDARDLTPIKGVKAHVLHVSPQFPEEITVGLNDRRPEWHDVYRIHLINGERTLLERNDAYAGYVVDDDYRLPLAARMTPDGGTTLYRSSGDGQWLPWEQIPAEDTLTTGVEGMDKAGAVAFLRDSRGRNTSAVTAVDLATKQTTVLAEDARSDAGQVLRHPTQRHVQAVSFTYERQRWQVLDPDIRPDMEALARVADGNLSIVSRTLDDAFWVVQYGMDDGPTQFYLYDRSQRRTQFLFTNRAALEGLPLVKMHSVVIPSRDGLDLVAYYSLPYGSDSDGDGLPDQPLPLVFTPHGGPWARDHWGFHPWHQWLANRGYAVLNVNFRSSTGFGKAFANAGDREWGGKVLADQEDAVRWAIGVGIADAQKVGVMGVSFGGYSALAGLTLMPDLYACGIDLVGPSNLVTLLETVPPDWTPVMDLFTTRVGDHRTEDGRALLTKHSPLTYVERIHRPLLIGQGANDPRVKQAESDQIVRAMQRHGIPVTYVLYPDEGHGFARPENNLSFDAIAEAFLAHWLGGRCEPVGDDFRNSSLQVVTGAEQVPSLLEALPS